MMLSTIVESMISFISTQQPFEKPWGNYLLENIVETQAPAKISWLPQTVGWQFVAIILVLLLGYKSYRQYKNYQRDAYRRHALRWIINCQQSDDIALYKQLPSLLRQTALNAFERSDITQLNGSNWEHWLDQQCQQTSFTTSCPTLLHQLAFKPITTKNFDANKKQLLITQITLWVKHHKRLND